MHNLLAQIDEFSSTAKLKSLSAEELVRRDVKELGKNVTDYATSIENRFQNRVQNFNIDVGNTTPRNPHHCDIGNFGPMSRI